VVDQGFWNGRETCSRIFLFAPAKIFFATAKFFLGFARDWIFTLDILEKRTVGAAAGKAGGGPRAAFVVCESRVVTVYKTAIIPACNR